MPLPSALMAGDADSRTLEDGAGAIDRLGTSVRQVRRDQMELGPTESDTGRSWFLLSSGATGADITEWHMVHG